MFQMRQINPGNPAFIRLKLLICHYAILVTCVFYMNLNVVITYWILFHTTAVAIAILFDPKPGVMKALIASEVFIALTSLVLLAVLAIRRKLISPLHAKTVAHCVVLGGTGLHCYSACLLKKLRDFLI